MNSQSGASLQDDQQMTLKLPNIHRRMFNPTVSPYNQSVARTVLPPPGVPVKAGAISPFRKMRDLREHPMRLE